MLRQHIWSFWWPGEKRSVSTCWRGTGDIWQTSHLRKPANKDFVMQYSTCTKWLSLQSGGAAWDHEGCIFTDSSQNRSLDSATEFSFLGAKEYYMTRWQALQHRVRMFSFSFWQHVWSSSLTAQQTVKRSKCMTWPYDLISGISYIIELATKCSLDPNKLEHQSRESRLTLG